MTMADAELARAVALIAGAESVALACHVEPDGDALGSLLGLHHLCLQQGKPSVASWPEPFVVAPHYTFLPGLGACTKPAEFPAHPDVMVTFDCGSLDRLNELGAPARSAAERGRLIVLDHHRTNARYGSINVCLYTGLVTDTGRFQYEATTPEVFALAGELAGFDLPIARMSRQLFEEHRFAYLKLIAACLARAELDRDLGLVSTWVTEADLEAYDVALPETEGLIDLVRRAQEADVACVLKETPGGIRVSMRSVGAVDVSGVALRFGGGGHAFASGFTADGPLERVLADIREAVREAKRSLLP
jgi:phosphoesterase RecJ-like protein